MNKKKNMKRYGNSGISAYETGAKFIRIQFANSSIYLYTYQSAGKDDIEYINARRFNSFYTI